MQNTFATSSNPWRILFATCLAVGMGCINFSSVNVALPIISQSLGNIPIAKSQWIVTSCTFATCIFLPIAGKLGDIYSRRNLFILGFIIFTAASLLCALTVSFEKLVIYRALQGLATSLTLANNQALYLENIPYEKYGLALGINTAVIAISSIIGPGIGGIILHWLSWQYIFLINVPIGILGCWMCFVVLPKKPKLNQKISNNLDILGALLLFLVLGLLLLLISDTWHTKLIVNFVLGIIGLFTLFFFWEKRANDPIVDFKLFKNPTYIFNIGSIFFILAALNANSIILPFFLYHISKLDQLHIGLVMLLPPAFTAIFALVSGYLIDKAKSSFGIFTGIILLIIALLITTKFNENTAFFSIMISQIILGIGYGLFQLPNNYCVNKSIPSNMLGSGNSIASLIRNIGRTLGVIFITSMFSILEVHAVAINCTTTCQFVTAFKGTYIIVNLLVILALTLQIVFAIIARGKNNSY